MNVSDPLGVLARELADRRVEALDASRDDDTTQRTYVANVPPRETILALQVADGVCDVCHLPSAMELAMLFDANDHPVVALCADCAAACIRVTMRVKIEGLMRQWRTQKAIHAARLQSDRDRLAAAKTKRSARNDSE